MTHIKRLSLSFKETFQNPSLIAVGVAQLILLFLIGLMIELLSFEIAKMGVINTGIVLLLLFTFSVAIPLVVGVFAAGFYFMVKNVIKDGSTTIREFFPGVRRYWGRCVLVYMLKYFVIPLLLFGPVYVFAQLTIVDTVSKVHPWVLLSLVVIAVLLFLLVNFYWLFWVVEVIVFEDETVRGAIIQSARLANRNVKKMIGLLLISTVILVVYTLIEFMVGIGMAELFRPYAEAIIPTSLATFGVAVQILIQLVQILFLVFISLFIFHSYTYILEKSNQSQASSKRRGGAHKRPREH